MPRHSVTNASLLAITPSEAIHVTRLPLHVATAERGGTGIAQVCAAPVGWGSQQLPTSSRPLRSGFPAHRSLALPSPPTGPGGDHSQLEARFGEMPIVTAELVDALIGPKDASDLASLRKAATAAQEAFDAGVAVLRPGSRPADAVRAAEESPGPRLGTWHCFAGGTDAQGRSLLQSSEAVLAPGTTGFFEVIPDIDGFCPEIVSTLFVGEVPEGAEALHTVICDTLELALASISAQMTFGGLFSLMMAPLSAAGALEDDVTRLGHVTGLDNIELPEFLDPSDGRAFGPGHVLSIPPNARTASYGTLFPAGP